jgi:hypothetical protein
MCRKSIAGIMSRALTTGGTRVDLNALTDFFGQLSPKFFLEDPQRVRSPLYLVFLAIFFIACVSGILLTTFSKRLSKGNNLHRRIIDRYGTWLGWLGGVGIIVIALRYADIVLFSKRLWTFLDLLALVALGAHYLYYRTQKYPEQLATYREDERRRRYLPASATGRPPAGSRRRSR